MGPREEIPGVKSSGFAFAATGETANLRAKADLIFGCISANSASTPNPLLGKNDPFLGGNRISDLFASNNYISSKLAPGIGGSSNNVNVAESSTTPQIPAPIIPLPFNDGLAFQCGSGVTKQDLQDLPERDDGDFDLLGDLDLDWQVDGCNTKEVDFNTTIENPMMEHPYQSKCNINVKKPGGLSDLANRMDARMSSQKPDKRSTNTRSHLSSPREEECSLKKAKAASGAAVNTGPSGSTNTVVSSITSGNTRYSESTMLKNHDTVKIHDAHEDIDMIIGSADSKILSSAAPFSISSGVSIVQVGIGATANSPSRPNTTSGRANSAADSQKNCINFFKYGHCTYGDQCKFSHAMLPEKLAELQKAWRPFDLSENKTMTAAQNRQVAYEILNRIQGGGNGTQEVSKTTADIVKECGKCVFNSTATISSTQASSSIQQATGTSLPNAPYETVDVGRRKKPETSKNPYGISSDKAEPLMKGNPKKVVSYDDDEEDSPKDRATRAAIAHNNASAPCTGGSIGSPDIDSPKRSWGSTKGFAKKKRPPQKRQVLKDEDSDIDMG